uniref:LOW QUALITY PROTEIN: NACHT domain- and WD repeat-containing protein 1 n=1 Tax=Geotrypetes seraphini TaxID=260995 RepID=A0A6P8S4N2_GEOSA|nr:LOW QUALITY PROTEIN: NACHT domain- and WD repeat-containing protein 1 [Geotrypetes seraphini]
MTAVTLSLETRRQLFQGKTVSLPAKRNLVRVFISSTFADMAIERNVLLERAYTEAQAFCQKHGLLFEVVDMRWGVRDYAAVDHMTTELCLKEIKLCQQMSVGPAFIALLGNRYGYRPIPRIIEEKEFDILYSKLRQDKNSIQLLDLWFWKDDNAIPPAYILQPITTHLQHYEDKTPAKLEQHENDVSTWRNVERALASCLRSAALEAEKEGLISEEKKHKYFKSVTEWEIEDGLLTTNRDKPSTAVFFREVKGINQHVGEEQSTQFLDIIEGGSLDTEAQHLLSELKMKITKDYAKHVKVHTVQWSKELVSHRNKGHARYLEELCEQFIAVINHQVLEHLGQQRESSDGLDWLVQEVSHHTSLCASSCKVFCGRQELLQHICQSINQSNGQVHAPLVVMGSSGAGKTALVCKVSESLRATLGSEMVIVLRLLGTSLLSTEIHSVLKSICLQVCLAFALPLPTSRITNIYNDTVRFFHSLLLMVSCKEAESLVLIFDSVDQLAAVDGAHRMHWLPKECPPRVHIIVSTLQEEILQTLQEAITNPESYVEVEPLSSQQGGEMIEMFLKSVNRKLTPAQHEVILQSFSQFGQPLLLKLAFEEARRWASYTVLSEVQVAKTIQEAVCHLYQRLERLHGKVLVSHTLGYLVSSRNGLSEAELKDVLSLDDEVLADIYQYWAPPSSEVIRLPSMLWTRLRFDLGKYLVERQADGYTVLAFYHRLFLEVVKECYLSVSDRNQRHWALGDFFQGTWSQGTKKPITLPFLEKSLEADRKVASQPLWFSDCVANLRKLSELPFHLLNAGRVDELKRDVLGNMSWISCKIMSCGIKSVIEDFAMCCAKINSPEAELLRHALLLFKPTVDFIEGKPDVSIVYTEMLARLLFFASSYPSLIGEVCQQCIRWLRAYPHPIFIPLCGFFLPPGGALQTTITGFKQGITVMEISTEHSLLIVGSRDGTIILWNVKDIEVIHTLAGHSEGLKCVKVFGKGTQAASCALDHTLRLWNLVTGKERHSVQEDHAGHCHSFLLHVDEKNGVVYSVCGSQINVWTLDALEPVFQVSGDAPDLQTCTSVFPPRRVILTVSKGGTLNLYNSTSGELQGRHQLPVLHDEVPVCSTMIPKYGKMVVGFSNGTLSVISASGTISLEKMPCCVKLVAVSEDESLFLAGFGKYVRIFQSEYNALRRHLAVDLEHEDVVETAVVCTSKEIAITGSQDETIRIWNLADKGLLLDSLDGMGVPVTLLALHGNILVSASRNSYYLKIWNLDYNPKHKTLASFQDRTGCTALSHSGDLVYFPKTGDKHKIVVWDSLQGNSVDILDASAEVCCLEVAEQKQLLFSGLASGTVLVFPLESRQDVMCIPPLEAQKAIQCIAVSKQEERLAVAYDDVILVYDINSGDSSSEVEGPIHTFNPGSPTSISSMAVLADYRLLYGMENGDLFLYECQTAKVVPLEAHGSQVTCIETSHRELHALSGCGDSIQRLWNLELCQWEHEMCYQGIFFQGILCACFSQDDQYVYTGSQDRTIKVWDVSKGSLLAVQYVYAAVNRILSTAEGFIATTRLGYVIKEAFQTPKCISQQYNPLQNVKAKCSLRSRQQENGTVSAAQPGKRCSNVKTQQTKVNQGTKASQICKIV